MDARIIRTHWIEAPCLFRMAASLSSTISNANILEGPKNGPPYGSGMQGRDLVLILRRVTERDPVNTYYDYIHTISEKDGSQNEVLDL